MSAETRALFKALLMLFEVLMAIFMEKTTGKDSRNSSLPPSQTSKDETAVTRAGGKSKGVKQNDARSRHSRTVTTTAVAAVDACGNCGADLGDTPSQSRQRRTRIDILFEKVVHHVDAEVKDCPRCQQRTTGRFPADMHGPLQYGNGLKAYMMNLLIAQMVPLDRVLKSVKTLIDVTISPATILKFVLRLHTALERWEASAIEELLRMPALNADETSLRVDRKNHWIHGLFRRRGDRQAPAPETRLRGHRRHRHHPPLRRCRGARLLGVVPVPMTIAATRYAARIS